MTVVVVVEGGIVGQDVGVIVGHVVGIDGGHVGNVGHTGGVGQCGGVGHSGHVGQVVGMYVGQDDGGVGGLVEHSVICVMLLKIDDIYVVPPPQTGEVTVTVLPDPG